MTKIATFIGITAATLLAGCESLPLPKTDNSAPPPVEIASVAPDSGVVSVASTPSSLYVIDKVTPTIAPDAAVGWFRLGEGSPREVGGFVGSALIEGLKGRFNGSIPLEIQVDIRQFEPVVGIQPYGVDAVHRVKLDMILKDARTGEEVGRSNDLYMDLVALTGTSAVIAQNAGRTPEVRLRERITQIGGAWAQELSCSEVRCPGPVIASAPAPTVVAAAPKPIAEAPKPVEVAPPAPVVVETPVVAVAPEVDPTPEVATAEPVADDAENPISSFFARITDAIENDAAEPVEAEVAEAPAAVVAEAPAPQPEPTVAPAPAEENPVESFFARLLEPETTEPAAEPVETAAVARDPFEAEAAPEPVAAPTLAPVAAASEPEAETQTDNFFTRLLKSDEAEETTVAEAPAPAPAPVAQPAAPAPVAAAPDEEAGSANDNFFTRLLASDEAEDGAVAEVEAPAPAPAPQVAAAEPAAPAPRASLVSQDPAPAIAPQPVQDNAVAQRVPPSPAPAGSGSAVVAQSPFFRSPAGTVPTLPQQALLGRSQRANDPLRRRAGDVVLEISNLPAFWDGDTTSGGVWVALPYVPAYRRAVVTNPVNGRTVEANLFWRDPQAGGGSTLLSSAAAEALGVAPGQVSNLGVKVVAAD